MSLSQIGFPPAPDERPNENAFGAILRGLMEGKEAKEKSQEKQGLIEHRKLENSLLKEFGFKEKQSKLDYEKALIAKAKEDAKYAGGQLTETQRDIGSVFKPGSPEFQRAMRDAIGLPESYKNETGNGQSKANDGEAVWMENSIPIVGLPKLSQRDAMLDNKKYLETGISMTGALDSIKTAESILNDHGHLSGSFQSYVLNPDSSNGLSFKDFMLSRGVSEKDRTAIQKMSKAFNDIVLNISNATGESKRVVTDGLRELIQSTKAQTSNTSEANRFILNNLKEKYSEGPELEKAARWATKNKRGLMRNPGAFKQKKMPDQEAMKADALNKVKEERIKELQQMWENAPE